MPKRELVYFSVSALMYRPLLHRRFFTSMMDWPLAGYGGVSWILNGTEWIWKRAFTRVGYGQIAVEKNGVLGNNWIYLFLMDAKY